MKMEVIPPGTHVNAYEAYDILLSVKQKADILLPLHEPKFASMPTIGAVGTRVRLFWNNRPCAFGGGCERYGEGVFFRPAHIRKQMVRTAPRGMKKYGVLDRFI